MWTLVKLALGFLPTILGWFGIGKKDERDVERKAGENLGIQETENANAKAGIDEIATAVQARDSNHAAVTADPGRLLNGKDAAATSYRPGPD